MRATFILGAAVAMAIPTQQQPPLFRSTADAVLVHVSVRNGNRSVLNLRCEDFQLFDGGVPQQLTSCDYAALPLELQMVLDRSESVTDSVRLRIDATEKQIRAAALSHDRITPVEFASAIQSRLRLSSGARIDSGHTTLWDAIGSAMLLQPEAGRRRLAFILTDGVDSGSILPQEAVHALVARADIALHVFAIADRRPAWLGMTYSSSSLDYFWFLRQLTHVSGGSFRDARPTDDLHGLIVDEIGNARSQYLLRYIPQGVAADGWHPIEVRVLRGRGVDVVARKGYYR